MVKERQQAPHRPSAPCALLISQAAVSHGHPMVIDPERDQTRTRAKLRRPTALPCVQRIPTLPMCTLRNSKFLNPSVSNTTVCRRKCTPSKTCICSSQLPHNTLVLSALTLLLLWQKCSCCTKHRSDTVCSRSPTPPRSRVMMYGKNSRHRKRRTNCKSSHRRRPLHAI